MNFWTARAYQNTSAPKLNPYVPPEQFPWQNFSRPPTPPPNFFQARSQLPGQGPVGNPGLHVGRPADRNPNKPGLGWGGLNPKRNGPQDDLDIITANLSSYKGWKHTKKSLDALLARDPRYMGLQEMRGRKVMNRTKRYLGRQGYGFYGKYGTPIAFDRGEVKLVDRGARRLTNPTRVGNRGAGGPIMKTQNATWGVFKERGGGPRQSVTNVHFSPSQYIASRRRLAAIQARRTGQLQNILQRRFGKGLEQYVLGDMNSAKGRVLNPISKAGVRGFRAPRGTFQQRKTPIDWIMGDRGIGNRSVFNIASDHHAYGASFDRNPNSPGRGWAGTNPKRRNRKIKRQNPNPPRRRG